MKTQIKNGIPVQKFFTYWDNYTKGAVGNTNVENLAEIEEFIENCYYAEIVTKEWTVECDQGIDSLKEGVVVVAPKDGTKTASCMLDGVMWTYNPKTQTWSN